MSLFDRLRGYGPALALFAVPAVALALGLALALSGRHDAAALVYAAGVLPVLAVLLVTTARALARGDFGLDVIAALAMAGALLAGEALAGVVVALMFAGGQALEAYAQGRARREMTALLGRVARTAAVRRGSALVETAVEAIAPGDIVYVRTGEVVPVDGVVSAGVAVLDESALTGESLPVERRAGAAVASGVVAAGAPFDLTALRPAADSTYAGIVRLVEAARASKAPMQRLADRYALGFLAVTLVLCAAAWLATGDPTRALAVLVVATPCPLILAVPVAIVAGMSRCARRGVLVKSARTLERLPQIRTVVFDKTGTVTEGRARIAAVEPQDGIDGEHLVHLAASLAQASGHAISRALVEAAEGARTPLVSPRDVVETPGDGVAGIVGAAAVVIGRPDFVTRSVGLDHAPRAAHPGSTVLAVAIDGALAGRIVFSDVVRAEAIAVLGALRGGGIDRIVLLTGDQEAVAAEVAARLGVDRVVAEASPARKVEEVRAHAAQAPTMMIGDGVNDAPALAAADLGVALGARGAAAASEAADIVVLVDRIDRVAEMIAIARRTRAIALQSVVVGIGLSLAGMVAAAFGYLTPLTGALLQEAIDVAVVLNALRALGGPAFATGRDRPPPAPADPVA